jgi:hypothetical protein
LGGGVVSAFEIWSDIIFVKACGEATGADVGAMFWFQMMHLLRSVFEDPKNWRKVRIPRDAKTRRQAGRVTRALRRGKPGELIWL